MKSLNVLSLCDGMSCGHIALEQAGFNVNKYYASEIKNIAIKVTNENYPDTVNIGDVNKVSYKDGVLYTEKESADVLGDGWTVPVISHIFSFMNF